MAKVTSLLGGLRGKASNMVFAKTGGSVIMREYNPSVSNPNTVAQVGQRSKFKLMSQLSAALADAIVIPKNGLVSARNRFMQINIGSCVEVSGVAQVTYENLQLSEGNMGLPGIYVNRQEANNAIIELNEAASQNITRVIYWVFKKSSDELLTPVLSAIVSIPGDDYKFRISGLTLTGEIVVFAYGMRDLNAAATAKYGSYNVATGEDIARLVANRSISASDYKFTKTRGTTLFAGDDESVPVGENQVRIYATATAGGSVSGAGVKTIGDQVTLVATPSDASHRFVKWIANGDAQETALSTNANWTFTASVALDVIAVFEAYTPADPILTITNGTSATVDISCDGHAHVQSGDEIPAGTRVHISVSGYGGSFSAQINGQNIQLTNEDDVLEGSFVMPSTNSTLVFDDGSLEG